MGCQGINLPMLDYTFDSHPEPGEVLRQLKFKLDSSDAFIIVSPEYNASYSGSLKNSMDYFFTEYAGKPFGIISVSSGILGGVNALKNLQQYVIKLGGIVCPQFLLTPKVQTLFSDGNLKNEGYSQRTNEFLTSFFELTKRFIRYEVSRDTSDKIAMEYMI